MPIHCPTLASLSRHEHKESPLADLMTHTCSLSVTITKGNGFIFLICPLVLINNNIQWSNLASMWVHLPLFGTLIWPSSMSSLTLSHVTFDHDPWYQITSQKISSPLCTMVHIAGRWWTMQVDGGEHSSIPLQWCTTYVPHTQADRQTESDSYKSTMH